MLGIGKGVEVPAENRKMLVQREFVKSSRTVSLWFRVSFSVGVKGIALPHTE